jgi:DNA polymerase III sliding clamp (beta) subunit (PCNA family)
LDSKEGIAQSHCFVFIGGRVVTFNGEIICSADCLLDSAFAIEADPLLKLLHKMTEKKIEVDSQSGTELLVKGKRRRAGIPLQDELLLPVSGTESPEEWKPLPDGFTEALGGAGQCAGNDNSQFVLTCVNITPRGIEASDRQQACRYLMKLDLEGPVLISRDSADVVSKFDATEISASENWLHFRSPGGVVLSCRRHEGVFPSLSEIFKSRGVKTKLPSDMESVLRTCEIFSGTDTNDSVVAVDLKSGKMKLKSWGVSGWYEELKKVEYDGDPISFVAAPKLLMQVASKSNQCEVMPGKLQVRTKEFVYVTCTSVLEDEDGK